MRFSFTFLGHSTFLFRTTAGASVILDPWLETNPACPPDFRRVRELDLMLLTHGHRDHTADAVGLARATGAQVIAPYELALWLEEKGLKRDRRYESGRNAVRRRDHGHDGAGRPQQLDRRGRRTAVRRCRERLRHPLRARTDDLLRGRH